MTIRAVEHKTLDWIRRQGLFVEGDPVLLALSGGADSVCLARVLLALKGVRREADGQRPPLRGLIR